MSHPTAEERHGKGQARPRREDPELVLGRGAFLEDLTVDGMLHAAFSRSLLAHALVREVDTSGVTSMPGVVAVFTGGDLSCPVIPGRLVGGPEGAGMERPPLATEKVRYVGEPVAIVIAEQPAQAVDALERVHVDLEELQPVTDPHQALADEVLLFPHVGTNVVSRETADGAREEVEEPVLATVTVEQRRVAPMALEPIGILAVPEISHRGASLEVWCGHQNPHGLQRQLTGLLGLERATVRVPHVGGAFGLKGALYPEYLVVCAAALRLGRPLRWVERRREHFLGGHHGRGQINRVDVGGDSRGRIRSLRLTTLADVGAYPHSGGFVPQVTRLMATGPYDIQDLELETVIVATNRAPIGPYRGAGRPEATFALERAVDEYARALGMDPVEVRRRNLIAPGQMPYTTATGAIYDGGDYRGALERALEIADVPALRSEQRRRREAGEAPLGIGVCVFVEQAGGSALTLGEYGRVEIAADGRVTLFTGSTPSGQGHATAWTQVVASSLGVSPETVDVVAGDTALVAAGFGSFGSRSTQLGATAAFLAAEAVANRARQYVAQHVEAAVEDIVITDGIAMVRGAPETAVSLQEIAAAMRQEGDLLAAEETFVPGAQTFPYGAYVAVVEVDRETGEVSVDKLVMVDDCGTRINPMLVDGQILGGMAQGLGQALYEQVVYDERGQLLTGSLIDYALPRASDVPEVALGEVVSPAPSNPLGAKGVGEAGTIGVPPAIVSAVLDALEPLGVTDISMPLTPERVWTAIRQATTPASI